MRSKHDYRGGVTTMRVSRDNLAWLATIAAPADRALDVLRKKEVDNDG